MNWFGFILAQCLNALSQAAILFFIACGLTLIFGIMRIVNFAHGVIFMLGAYVGYTVNVVSGSFLLSLVVAPVVVGLVGMAFEWSLLRHLYGRRDGGAYLLLTFGLAVVHERGDPADLGRAAARHRHPRFPARHRHHLRPAVPALSAVPDRARDRRRAGDLAVPRAHARRPADPRGVAEFRDGACAGHRRRPRAHGVFGFGCALAALGGVLAAPLVTAFLGMGTSVVIDAFVIVIIGGMGSFLGSIIGSVLVAFVQVMGAYYFQDLALAFMYLLMLLVLVVRPGGLLGKED